MGRGEGLVVSVLAFYFNNLSSNSAETYSFFCKICVLKNENTQKEAGGLASFFKKIKVLWLNGYKLQCMLGTTLTRNVL